MARPLPVVEHAMEVQSRVRLLRKEAAPMFEAAMATGNFEVMAETHALAEALRISQKIARRIAGLAEGLCADGIAEPGHGAAA